MTSTETSVMKSAIFGDVDRELTVTRDVLSRVPADQFAWKPAEKSMSLMRLAIHVADLPEWARVTLDADELNFETASMPPKEVATTDELLAFFDRRAEGFRKAVASFDMSRWENTWTMRDGGQVIASKPRPHVYRVWCMNHLISHRAQLNVYLRLLNVPVATLYFNSADDPDWRFE